MGTYIPFTEQQREQARLTDLAAYLRQCGEEVKRCGSENMWLDHGQKVTIRATCGFTSMSRLVVMRWTLSAASTAWIIGRRC